MNTFTNILYCILFLSYILAADASPPAIPEIQAFPQHEKIVIYWDSKAENSIDPETGYADFEGYRLYRSTDGGETWGKLWDKIFDYSGNLVNWKPFVQYDLSEKQDTSHCVFSNAYDYDAGKLCDIGDSTYARKVNYKGYDPLALWVNLGDDTGIYRSYVDTDVVDGVEYTYAVTSYDTGLRSYTLEFVADSTADSTGNIFKADTTWSPSNPGKFTGINGLGYPSFETPRFKESFADYNANGKRDDGEPFIDENSDLIWNDRENPINVITIKPGYYASNISFPDVDIDEEIDRFIVSDSSNIGNGFRSYRVVNTEQLEPGYVKFEIDACLDKNGYGNKLGSFSTGCSNENQVDCAEGCLSIGPPSLYAYEVMDSAGTIPSKTINQSLEGVVRDSVLFYMGLPGADTSLVGSDSIIALPEYVISDHKLAYLDDPNYEAKWTEWFKGVQFRFDNGSELIPSGNSVILRDVKLYGPSSEDPDSLLLKGVQGILKYKANLTEFYSRPNYSYKIEFSNTQALDSAYRVGPVSACDHMPTGVNTPLPFKITNITLDQEVLLWHMDKGIEQSMIDYNVVFAGTCDGCDVSGDEVCIFGTCQKRVGYKNCNWESGEILHFTDIIYTSNNLAGDDAKLMELKLDVLAEQYAELLGLTSNDLNNLWEDGRSYSLGEIVNHNGWAYTAIIDIDGSAGAPGIWYDSDSDFQNDNPWKIMYPWKDGDYYIIEPYKWFVDGDSWVVNLSDLGREDDDPSDDMNGVRVVPNPYMAESIYNENPGDNRIRFTNLPVNCTITIYTVSGEFVASIDHSNYYDGNEWWDVKNANGEHVAPGLYIYTVETPSGDKLVDKFAVVR